MSLINQMLRDLEKRRETGSTSRSVSEQPAAVNAALPKRRWLWLITGLPTFFIVLWIVSVMVSAPQPSPVMEQASPVEKIIPVNGSSQASVGTVVQLKDNAGEKTSSQSTTRDIPVQIKTFKLLNLDVLETGKSARLMLEFDRLPDFEISENADHLDYLSIFLANVTEAVSPLLSRIGGGLVKKVELETQNFDLWLSVELDHPVRTKSLKLPADRFHGPRLLIELTVVEQPSATEVVAVEEAQPQLVSQEKAVSTQRVKKISQALSQEHYAQMAYAKGLKELQSGDQVAAESSFHRALELNSALLEARFQLADLLQEQNSQRAKELILAGLPLHPGNIVLRKRLARLWITEKQPELALDLLQQSPVPSVNEDQEYHALLAAVLQETGQYAAAAESYTSLLQLHPQQPLWWVGRGIALEQTGKPDQARESYQRALSIQGLRQDLQDYVRSRLQAL